MKTTILICGDRNWTNQTVIYNYLYSLLSSYQPHEITIVEGGCKGADNWGGYFAKQLGMTVIEERADWAKYGNAAGPIRNQFMLDKYHPDLVVAFHDDLEHSKGTKDMVNRAKEQGFAFKVFNSQQNKESKP